MATDHLGLQILLRFSMSGSQLQLQWTSKANRNICESYDETETNGCSFWESALAPHTYVSWCLDSSIGLVIIIIQKTLEWPEYLAYL